MTNTDEAEAEAEPSCQIAITESFIDEHSEVLWEKYLKILKEFIASNDEGQLCFYFI